MIAHSCAAQDQKKEPGGGADALRLWAMSVDYTNDVGVGPTVLAQTLEALRKVCAFVMCVSVVVSLVSAC